MKVTVKRGRTVTLGQKVKGELVKTNYGPGEDIEVPKGVGEALIEGDNVVRAGTPEAKAAKAQQDVIPGNFPHADLLAQNGIETFSALPRTLEELVDLDDIGEGRAEDILEALPEE